MTVLFVTAFIDLQEGRERSQTFYLEKFAQLADTGIRIHLFLSAAFFPEYMERIGARENIRITSLELDELLPVRVVGPYRLPAQRNLQKDTANYMLMINGKMDIMERAALANPDTHLAWIDFGIFHVLGPEAPARIRAIAAMSLPAPFNAFPGCWSLGGELFSRINWRHCGGFFIADRDFLLRFNDLYRCHFARIVQENGLAWEVNIWHKLELEGLALNWYKADHNDSILAFPGEN